MMKEFFWKIYKIVVLLLILMVCGLTGIAKTRINLAEDCFFIGDSLVTSDSVYFSGTVFNPDMTKVHGLFAPRFGWKLVSTEFPDSTMLYLDNLYHGRLYNYVTIFQSGKKYGEYMNQFQMRHYNFQKSKWITNHYAYDSESICEKDEITSWEDRFCIFMIRYIVMPILFIFVIGNILSLVPKWKVFSGSVIPAILCIGVFIGAAFLPENWVYGIFTPSFMFFILIGVLAFIPSKKAKHTVKICAGLLFFSILAYQYVFTKEEYTLSDGAKISLVWQRGTDPIKRHVVKNILSNLIVIPGTDQYMCRYELRRYEASIIMGGFGSWVTAIRPNEVMDNLSYYDAKAIIRKLKELAGTPFFTLPSAETWLKAVSVKDRILFRHFDELQNVGSGSPNHLGFYDLEGNVSEWTKSEFQNIKISRNGKPLPDLSYSQMAGGSYDDNNFNLATTPKGLGHLSTGMRVGFGIVSKAKYMVRAILQDTIYGFPCDGILMEVKGKKIADLDWDDIYELLISESASDRIYGILQIDTIHKKKIMRNVRIKANNEPYHFYPIKTIDSQHVNLPVSSKSLVQN